METPDAPSWAYLPYPALYSVFSYLNYKDLLTASEVCRAWYEASRYDLLWKRLFYLNFSVPRNIPVAAGETWYSEFKRLCFHVPLVEAEILTDHTNQVLHVSFSHNGRYFATCSKDGYVLLWTSSFPAGVKYYRDMKIFSWKYTQYSQFNESDSLLLVSGVHFGSPHSTSGEIAVFNIHDGFQLQCRVVNKPYDIFGTWYSDQYLLSGDLHWLAHLVSTSYIWLNRASQEADSEHTPITQHLFRFYNRNASSVRAVMVANCLTTEDASPSNEAESRLSRQGSSSDWNKGFGLRPENSGGANSGECVVSRICYNVNYRKAEREIKEEMERRESEGRESSVDFDEDDCDTIVQHDKYLIFTTGYKTYSPHQIGLKRIKPVHFPKKLDPGPSLKERLALKERAREEQASASAPPAPDWLDYDAVSDKFDKVDHLIDLHGHIVGMSLSPDHRYLFVNTRAWPKDYIISNPLDPPPIAQEIDIHVIDLVTLQQVGTMLRAHRAYTPNSGCFFIFLDVSNKYVASGAEDKHGYLWDRHYGICLAKYPHSDVVNCVAFNPRNSEMLVTTSDDNTVKIWRSRAMIKSLELEHYELRNGIEIGRVFEDPETCVRMGRCKYRSVCRCKTRT